MVEASGFCKGGNKGIEMAEGGRRIRLTRSGSKLTGSQ
jgi:hypothetical protein